MFSIGHCIGGVSSGQRPVDMAKTDEIKALLRKAEEARGCLGPV